jgi:hypothetical protein
MSPATYEPRHRRPTHVYAGSYARCTCARTLTCPHHFPTLYAERYAKHKAVA